jgi:hypothetical protein
MLKGLDADVLKMIQEIIKMKKPTKNTVIVVDDIKTLIEPKKTGRSNRANVHGAHRSDTQGYHCRRSRRLHSVVSQ